MAQPPPPPPLGAIPPADGAWTPTPPPVVLTPPYAGFGTRFVAALIDFCCLLPIYAVLLIGGVDRMENSGTVMVGTSDLSILRPEWVSLALALALARWTYQFLMIGRWNATVGKFALGIRVRLPDGSRAGWREAALRPILEVVLGLLGIDAARLLDGLWMLWDKQKQTLHDKVAGTIVVHR